MNRAAKHVFITGAMTIVEHMMPTTRVGVIVPQSNTTNEVEFHRLAPPGLSFHFARVPLHKSMEHGVHLATLTEDLRIAAGHLGSCVCDLIVFGCTADSMAFGDDTLLPVIQDASGGVPALTTATAITSILSDLDVSRIALASLYTEQTNNKEAAFLEGAGFQVVAAAGLGLNTSLERIQKMSRVPPEEVFELAMSVNTPEAEALLICCTDFNTLDVIDRLESALQKPVISSNVATFATALQRLGVPGGRDEFGRVIAALPRRAAR